MFVSDNKAPLHLLGLKALIGVRAKIFESKGNMIDLFNMESDLLKHLGFSQKYQSIFLPKQSFWKKCWSLPLLSVQEKKNMALIWNNS